MKRWGRVYSLRFCPPMCISIWPAYFELIPPWGSSNCPSVFGQAWKRADSIQSTMTREWRTQVSEFLSPHRQLGAQLQRMPTVSRFGKSSPRCKTDHERRFIGQCLADLWDSAVPHNDNTPHRVTWRDTLKVLKYHQLHLCYMAKSLTINR